MFENIKSFFKKFSKNEKIETKSKDKAKERLHLVLMQDRANVSADFLELMKQEIIEVIKKYIDVDEEAIDVKLTNKTNGDGTVGAPALYANIPIVTIKNEARQVGPNEIEKKEENEIEKKEENKIEQKIDKQQGNKIEEKAENNAIVNEDEGEKKEEIIEENIEVVVQEEKDDNQANQNNEETDKIKEIKEVI